MMIEVITLDEIKKWNNIILNFDKADSYYTPNYVIPFKENGEGEPILIYYDDGELKMINVVIKRDIALLERFKNKIEINTHFDFITPYGYGGMIIEGNEDNIPNMLNEYGNWCIENNIVSEFVRFHPLINLDNRIYEYFNSKVLGPTITVKIDDMETVWKNYTSNNRNTIRKAIKNKVNITYGNQAEDYNEFKRLYLQTMKNINSDEYYYFSDIFYKSLYKEMNDNMLIFKAIYENIVVATSLIIFGKENVHYHLSGSDYQYRSLSATNLLLDKVVEYGYKEGYKYLHLGGGVGSKEDSLYKFKRNFNPKSKTVFKIGRKVYIMEKYENLSSLCKISDEEFFPKYREKS